MSETTENTPQERIEIESIDTPSTEQNPENPDSQPNPDESTHEKQTQAIKMASINEIVNELRGEIVHLRQDISLPNITPFGERIIEFILTLFPILRWIYHYKSEYLLKDIQAGLTVGIICIPGALIYGLIGNVPPIYGLYSTMSGMLLYAILGTSREMSSGATPMLSIVYSSAILVMHIPYTIVDANGIETSNPEFVAYAILLSFFSGVIIFIVGFLRLGFLASLFSQPMISGFTSASAIVIIVGQIKNLVGIKLPSIELVTELVPALFENLHKLHAPTLLLSIITIVALLSNNVSKYFKKIPVPLIMVAVGSITCFVLSRVGFSPVGSTVYGIKVIGDLPPGIPKPAFYVFGGIKWVTIGRIFVSSLIVAIISVIESLSVAKYYAKQNGYNIDTNQELIAIGIINIGGILFNGPPSGGALSRSSINAYSGAKTQLSSIISFVCFFLCLIVLTPFFFYVPFCVLSAMIIVSCAKLIDFKEVIYTWRVNKADTFVLVSTFLVVIIFGLVDGALYGILISLGIMIVKMSRSEIEILGRVPGSQDFVKKTDTTVLYQNILVVKNSRDFRYLNANHFRSMLLHLVHQKSKSEPVRAVVIDGSNLRDLDTSVIYALIELVGDFASMNIELYIAGMSEVDIGILDRAGFFSTFDQRKLFSNLHLAVKFAESKVTEPIQVSIEVMESNTAPLLSVPGLTDYFDTDANKSTVQNETQHDILQDQDEISLPPTLKMENAVHTTK